MGDLTTISLPSPATAAAKPRLSAAELAPQVLEHLPGRAGQIAKALGRKASDGSVRRALEGLEHSGLAEQTDGGVWERCADDLPAIVLPEDFDEESIELHARTLQALREQGTWRDHDAELLERYVRRHQDAREFRAAVQEQGRFQTPAKRGSRVYAHPGIDKERDALRDVQGLAEALVLTPDARRRHGRDGDGDDETSALFDL